MSVEFKGKKLIKPNTFGFIYLIEYEDGKKYIGKKQIVSIRELPALKNLKKRDSHIGFQGRIKNRKAVMMEKVMKQTKWENYTGSNKYTSPVKSKKILEVATNKRSLTYLEAKHLFNNNVLESDEFVNDNILGKFFNNCIE